MNSIKQVVPWFDKQEWELVYNLAYSMDPDLQRRAYQHMAIWRARVSDLCMGVECTQAFLHVRLCETKKLGDGTPAFEDIDLQPIYSTAVMRFLNHLQGFCDNKTTLYQMADKYDIPEWIVNMRHETAHGNKLPSLGLLRDASNFIFEWLNKNYWENEMSKMIDLVLDPPKLYDKASVEMTLEKLLELWKCVKLYHMGGFKKIEDVPNNEKLSYAISELENICQQKNHSKKKFRIFTKISNHILHCIFQMIEIKTINKEHAEQSLISKLLNNQSFLPSVSLQKKFFKEPAIEILLNIWEEIIIEIQKHGLLLNLLRALIEITNDCSDSRHNIAALWIHCLVSSLKFQRINKQVKLTKSVIIRVLEQLTEKLSSHLCPPDVVEFVIKASYQTFKQSLPLEPLSYVGRTNVRQVVKEALRSPTENTSLYISSLLDLWEPPLTASNKFKLCRLVKLYTKEMNSPLDNEDTSEDIMSLQMLLGDLSTTMYDSTESVNEIANEVDCDGVLLSNSQEGNWTIYSGEENWGKCALGRIPLQNKNFIQILMEND